MSLKTYNTKRNFEVTSEPEGTAAAKDKKEELIFVVQRHKASRLHYDFRLELDGALKSWAVPKGPSLNPADKRLAMMVEDHPYDYKDFEGVIPAGNYGAGIVEIWDNGAYDAVDEKGPVRIVTDYAKKVKLLEAGLEAGNLKFRLKGQKLEGEFALVRIKAADDNSWLLIKHRDDFATDDAYDSEKQTEENSPINQWLAENKPGKVAARAKKTATKTAKAEGKDKERNEKPEAVVVKKKP